jgi:cytochrome b561
MNEPKQWELRLWHWLNGLCIFCILLTVFLRKTFLSWRANTALIQEKANELGLTVPPDAAKKMAVAMRDRMWEWHYPLGLTLAGLFAFRIVVHLLARRKTASSGAPDVKDSSLHMRAVKAGYFVFYLALFTMVATGLTLYFFESPTRWVKEVHEWTMWLILGFSLLHVFGVFVAENRDQKGIVSRMINGGS